MGALCFTDYAHRDGNVPGLVWHVLGAGLISDSFQYTARTRNFARGSGISLPYGDGELEPMTKYPPLFPVFLAFFEIAGGSSLQGARILNILLFGVNIFYVAMLDVLYGLVIVVSKAWIDADIGLSDRILSPMLVSLLILMATGLSFLWNRYDKSKPFVLLAGLALFAHYGIGTFTSARGFHETGIGIARGGCQRSEVIQNLRSYSAYSMYTKPNSSLYMWSDRAGDSIPDFELLTEKGTDARIPLVVFHHIPPDGKRLNELVSDLELPGEDQVVSINVLDP